MPRPWVGLLFLLVAAGCSDEGDPLDPGPEIDDRISFVEQIQPIFDANCIACHGADGNGSLDLRGPQSHDDLVNVPALGYAARRVVPAEPDSSVLYGKVLGDSRFGDRMPLDGPYLPTTDIELIHDWIAQGASSQ